MEEYYTSRYAQGTDVWTMKDHDEILVKFLPQLTGGKGSLDFFLPLCGKSAELVMLADQGHRVTGAEWSETAIQQFFEENKLEYSSEPCTVGGTQAVKYVASSKAITIYRCDFLAFRGMGQYDCVWDTASIGCFDSTVRPEYVKVITELTKPGGMILLTAFDYDHSEHPSVPFAVTPVEVESLYGASFDVQLVHELDLDQTLKQLQHRERKDNFQPWTLSRFAKKYYLLKKI